MQTIQSPLANGHIDFIKRKGEPIPYDELERQLAQAKSELNLTRIEHEKHLDTIRQDRDNLHAELNNIMDWMTAVTEAIDRDVPSITKQTTWKTGFFNMGKLQTPDVRYFNCSLCSRYDGDWLIVRRARQFNSPKLMPLGQNDLVAFHLNEEHVPTHASDIIFPRRYNKEHFEDPRVTWMFDKLHVSATNFQLLPGNKWTGCHQIISPLNGQWQPTKVYDPVFGKNGGTLYMQKGNEKNWLWFEHDGLPHLIYLTVPHRVVKMNTFFEKQEVYETSNWNLLWRNFEPRGGTPPIRVGDEYFSFFHSSGPWLGKKRRYYMGAYAFEAKPPFAVTRCSSLPILTGSKNDPWSEGLPLVVFPCGSILRNGTWFVTLGVNDCVSAWIEIPHEELLCTLRKADPFKEETDAKEMVEEKGVDYRDDTLTQVSLGHGAKFVSVEERPAGSGERSESAVQA